MQQAHIQPFLDLATWTVSYGVWDARGRAAAVIDPVLDRDFKAAAPRPRRPTGMTLDPADIAGVASDAQPRAAVI